MIRRYHPIDDYAGALAIYKSSFGPEFTEMLFRQHLTSTTWVYEVDDRIIAYIITRPDSDGVYLVQVAVSRDCRGCGIATELIKYVEVFHKPLVMWLQVQADNPAQKLYFDLGYRVTRFEKDLYGPESNGLRMAKSSGN